jgi:hypothetical protein
MRLLFLALVAALGALATETPAQACGNAVRAQVPEVATLREADKALDEGDMKLARELARSVLEPKSAFRYAPPRELKERARRIESLSHVRDPLATETDIERAVAQLGTLVVDARRGPTGEASPALVEDHGEALERAGRDEDALAELEPLGKQGLLGSPYALAALARATSRRDHVGLQSTEAYKTCVTISDGSRACDGVYPKQPLLRGSPFGYLAPGFVLALAGLHRRRARRALRAPWSAYRARLFAAIVAASGVVAFMLAYGRHPYAATLSALAAVLFVGVVQRRAFFRACRAGKVDGMRIRGADAEDEALPVVKLAFGPLVPEILDRVVPPAYRTSAREPILRIEGRPLRVGLLALTVTVVLVFVAFGTLASLFLLRAA